MKKGRKIGAREKLLFPFVATVVIILLVPASAPLIAMFMLGNLFRESKVVERLTETGTKFVDEYRHNFLRDKHWRNHECRELSSDRK